MDKSEWLGVKLRMSPLKEALNSILVVPRGKEKCREHKPLAGGKTVKGRQSWVGAGSSKPGSTALLTLLSSVSREDHGQARKLERAAGYTELIGRGCLPRKE